MFCEVVQEGLVQRRNRWSSRMLQRTVSLGCFTHRGYFGLTIAFIYSHTQVLYML